MLQTLHADRLSIPMTAAHLGKRASGRTFSTGAEGAGGFQKARKAMPPSSTRAITMTNEMVSFPMHPTRSLVHWRRTGPAPIDEPVAQYASTLSTGREKRS